MKSTAKILTCGASALFAAVLCVQAQTSTSTQQKQPPSSTPPASSSDMSVRYSSDPKSAQSTSRDTLGTETQTPDPSQTRTGSDLSSQSSVDQNNASTQGSLSSSTSTYGTQSSMTASTQHDTEVRTIVQQIDAQGPVVVERISTQFSDIACSPDMARQIVEALHSGTSVTLTGEDGQSVSFAPTAKLGYGEAYVAMALAAETLRANGVTSCATPEQWRSVFLGGPLAVSGTTTTTASASSTSSFPGILVLREQGQGWSQIATTTNVQLGQVVSSARTNLNIRSDSSLAGSTGEMSSESSTTSGSSTDSKSGTSAYGSSTTGDRDSSLKSEKDKDQKKDPRNANAWEKSSNKDDKEMNSSDQSIHKRDDSLRSSTSPSDTSSAFDKKSTTRSTDDGSRWDKKDDKKKNKDDEDDKYRPKN